MGLKVPEPPFDYEKGRDCEACYPPGKTPKFFFIRFWDIEACGANPAPPNGITFICVQDPFIDCKYKGEIEFGGITWRCDYIMNTLFMGEPVSSLTLGCVACGIAAYFEEVGDPCQVDFMTNSLTCPDWGGEGGHAHVQIFVPSIIILLCTHYHFMTMPNKLYEMQEVAMDHKLVRIASRFDKSCCYFYIDDQDVDYW